MPGGSINRLTWRLFQHKLGFHFFRKELSVSHERLPYPREIELPADEGIFARSALVACLTDDECRLAGVPDTAAGTAVLDFISGMGYAIDKIDEYQVNLTGRGHGKPREPLDMVDCAGSADLGHLFAAFLAGWGLYGAVSCSDAGQSLKSFADAVKSMGGEILGRGDGCGPPWCIRPAALAAREIRPAHPHPSLRSALAMLFLLGQGTGSFPVDVPGHDGMERAIKHYRGEIRRSEGRLFIKGGERVLAKRRDMPRSFRLGVVMITAAAMTSDKPVRLPGVCLNASRAGTLELLGNAGVDFAVDNMTDIDGEVAADIIAKPSEPKGIELGPDAVRAACEDIGPLLAMACLSDGLSEFNLNALTSPEADGAAGLAGEIAAATAAAVDTGGNRITIEGNPRGESNEDSISSIGNYPARSIIALYHRMPGALDKSGCIDAFGRNLTQLILGDLLF
jgi:3-phosphoshikimate 1-carboxyvinyltransferase